MADPPGALFLMQFHATVEEVTWDEPTNTLLVTTDEGVCRVPFPELYP